MQSREIRDNSVMYFKRIAAIDASNKAIHLKKCNEINFSILSWIAVYIRMRFWTFMVSHTIINYGTPL